MGKSTISPFSIAMLVIIRGYRKRGPTLVTQPVEASHGRLSDWGEWPGDSDSVA